jgi:hypothetical protein
LILKEKLRFIYYYTDTNWFWVQIDDFFLIISLSHFELILFLSFYINNYDIIIFIHPLNLSLCVSLLTSFSVVICFLSLHLLRKKKNNNLLFLLINPSRHPSLWPPHRSFHLQWPHQDHESLLLTGYFLCIF